MSKTLNGGSRAIIAMLSGIPGRKAVSRVGSCLQASCCYDSMELGVLLLGLFLRLMDWLLGPLLRAVAARRGAVPHDSRPALVMGAKQLADCIRRGELTSEEVVKIYIDRIKCVNPLINAVVEERYRDAMTEARDADRRLAEARRRNLKTQELLGVPFTVKESCSLAGLSNSVGCLENTGRRATKDGEVVRLMRAAGAIPLLVSNTPELCLGWESSNLLHGTTNNPYCLSRTAGGSSGGEAALIACCASPFGVASDIAGSIRIPAAFNGVFGHKPTPGVISIEGHIPTIDSPLFPRFLTVGPMSRRAEDLPLLTRIMAADRAASLRLDEPVDFTTLRVHFMTAASDSVALLPTERCVADAVVAAAEYLRDQCGSQLSDRKFKEFEDSVDMSISVFFSMKNIPNMMQDPNNPKRDRSLFLELLRSVFGGSSRSLQALGFHVINRTKLFIPPAKRTCYYEKTDKFREEFFKTLGTDGVLLYPVFPAPAHNHGGVFTRASGVMYTMLLNVLGAPATSVPVGLHAGLPVAVQVIAAPHQDRLCLAVAHKLEEAFGGWRPPP